MLPPAIAPARAAAASRRRPSSRANRRSASQSCGLAGAGRLRSGHASPKTTKLYDRTADTVTVDRDRANRDLKCLRAQHPPLRATRRGGRPEKGPAAGPTDDRERLRCLSQPHD